MSGYGAYEYGGQMPGPLPDPPAEVLDILAQAYDDLPDEVKESLKGQFKRVPPPPPPARPVFLQAGEAPSSAAHGGLLHTGPDGALYYTSPSGRVTKLAEG
jgi:hypothetical protein